jgi:D-3-phosphoglycerate dehydrogenase
MNGDSMRILALDGITIESPLNGNIICLRNRDVPGVIGKVGTVTGNHNVNIANFSLGRGEANGDGTEAIALVQVDNEVPEAVLADLRKIDAIRDVKLVRL